MIIPSHDDGIGYGMGFALWCLIYTAITNNRNVDLTTKKEKNIVSLIHASSVSILFLIIKDLNGEIHLKLQKK